MAIDKKYPTKQSIGEAVRKSASDYFGKMDKVLKEHKKQSLKRAKELAKKGDKHETV
jgi:hypothetical protein